MLANLSTPLLGMVDTAIVGQLPDPAYIGAVAIGALIFTFVFWAFGFLRMGTTGLSAQALGAGDHEQCAAVLARALLIALAAATALLVLQWPIARLAFGVVQGSTKLEDLAQAYFSIRIWAAPATLANYALLGWFVGLGRTRTALVLQLTLNLTNIALDCLFVLGLGWDVRGVAAGTVLAEWTATLAGLALAWRLLPDTGLALSRRVLFNAAQLRRLLAVNRDIMIRSLALIFVFVWFMAEGARQGEVILAANAVLMQFVSAAAYLLDGMAHAAEVLVGQAVGAGRRAGVVDAVRKTTRWAALMALLITVALIVGGGAAIDLMTVDAQTRSNARIYLPWAAAAPLLGVWAFQLDGIFIGATRTVEMRRAMLFSLAVFAAAWWLGLGWGNHGLWAALSATYLVRMVSLLYYYPRLLAALD